MQVELITTNRNNFFIKYYSLQDCCSVFLQLCVLILKVDLDCVVRFRLLGRLELV